MQKILIVGSSGYAKNVIDVIEAEGRYQIAGLLDRFRQVGDQTLDYPVLGREEDLPHLVPAHGIEGIFVAIGDNYARAQVVARVGELCPELVCISTVHPRATIGKGASLGVGSAVMANAIVGASCSLGRFTYLHVNASLGHDTVLKDFSSVAPRVATGGNCRIGAGAALAIGAVLVHRVTIGEHTVVGAGSVVVRSIAACKVAYGNPAKEVRDRKPGDKYL